MGIWKTFGTTQKNSQGVCVLMSNQTKLALVQAMVRLMLLVMQLPESSRNCRPVIYEEIPVLNPYMGVKKYRSPGNGIGNVYEILSWNSKTNRSYVPKTMPHGQTDNVNSVNPTTSFTGRGMTMTQFSYAYMEHQPPPLNNQNELYVINF